MLGRKSSVIILFWAISVSLLGIGQSSVEQLCSLTSTWASGTHSSVGASSDSWRHFLLLVSVPPPHVTVHGSQADQLDHSAERSENDFLTVKIVALRVPLEGLSSKKNPSCFRGIFLSFSLPFNGHLHNLPGTGHAPRSHGRVCRSGLPSTGQSSLGTTVKFWTQNRLLTCSPEWQVTEHSPQADQLCHSRT